MKNKIRGRAFQTKLAELSRGINVGTLGGEDIMHPEFSYEAKTYNINAKTYAGKRWKGEEFLDKWDEHYARKRLAIVKVECPKFAPLILLRWYWWCKLSELIWEEVTNWQIKEVNAFIGNTYMNQAEKNCPDAKLPVVVVHTTGRRHEHDVVLVRYLYWESLLNKILDKTI
jgi:hypothetical protein